MEAADYITFSSASTVEGFVKSYPDLAYNRYPCVAIGETTAQRARAYGFRVAVAKEATIVQLAEKLKELVNHED